MQDLMTSDDSFAQRRDSSGKFNIIKSLQLKTKKRKSLSLEHMPYFASSGEQIKVTNGTHSKGTVKTLSALQPGYTEPDIYKLTTMALDQTLKGHSVDDLEENPTNSKPTPKPEEALDFVVANKDTTGFELESLQVNDTLDGMETGKALMW